MMKNKQITKDSAISIENSYVWLYWTDLQRARFQVFQKILAIPYGVWMHSLNKFIPGVRELDLLREGGIEQRLLDATKSEWPTTEELESYFPEDKRHLLQYED